MPGFRQRLQNETRSRSPPPLSGHGEAPLPASLANWLSSWAWGHSSAADVVRNAQSAVLDGGSIATDPRVVRLAKCGRHLGNAERVVEGILPDMGLCAPVDVEDSTIHSVLQPHLVIPWLHSNNPDRFKIHLGGDETQVQQFWESFLERSACSEFRALHPWLRGRSPSDLRRHLPLMSFDDTGPVSAVHSSYARSWYSVIGKGAERETRFLVCAGLKDGSTEDRSCPIILESFRKLAEPKEEGQWGGILLFC